MDEEDLRKNDENHSHRRRQVDGARNRLDWAIEQTWVKSNKCVWIWENVSVYAVCMIQRENNDKIGSP